jgi:hypothetical protein
VSEEALADATSWAHLLISRSPSTVGGQLGRVEDLLKVKASSPTDVLRDVHKEHHLSRDRALEVSHGWHARAPESPKRQSDIDDQGKHINRAPSEDDILNDVGCMVSRSSNTKGSSEKLDSGNNGTGSLVVNEQGDLQYLGKTSRALVVILY